MNYGKLRSVGNGRMSRKRLTDRLSDCASVNWSTLSIIYIILYIPSNTNIRIYHTVVLVHLILPARCLRSTVRAH
jgi:hypothetical protein